MFDAAIAVADRSGLPGLTMRAVADELGVEAMSLYYHVENKEAILDGVANALVVRVGETIDGFTVPDTVTDWKSDVRRVILAARSVMLQHRWAPAVYASRKGIGPDTLRYFHLLLGLMKTGGVSYDIAHHTLHALGSRALGFSEELFQPDSADESADDLAAMVADLPFMVGMLQEIAHDDPETTMGWCDDQSEFEFALDVILDGVERLAG